MVYLIFLEVTFWTRSNRNYITQVVLKPLLLKSSPTCFVNVTFHVNSILASWIKIKRNHRALQMIANYRWSPTTKEGFYMKTFCLNQLDRWWKSIFSRSQTIEIVPVDFFQTARDRRKRYRMKFKVSSADRKSEKFKWHIVSK